MFLVLIISFFTILKFNLKFELIGNSEIKLDVFDTYKEEGYKATLFNKNITDKVEVDTNLNVKEIGSYNIKYKINIIGITFNFIRIVNVVDQEKPVITLNGDKTTYLFKDDEYIDDGAKALDNYDGDITESIIIENNINNKKNGEYEVIYKVKDNSGNEESVIRKVIVTNNKNKIKINNPMIKYIENNNYDISFGYYNLITGESYLYNEDKVYFAASLIKIVEALYLYENDLVTDKIKPYVKKTITVSNNDAHHYLQRVIGQDNLKKYGENLGAKHVLAGGSCCGKTTVNEQLIFLKKLYEITKVDNEELKSWFINDYVNNIKFSDDIKVMHKYGLYDNVYHNVGIVLDEEPYIVIILTGIPNGYSSIVNKLSRIIYDYHLSI